MNARTPRRVSSGASCLVPVAASGLYEVDVGDRITLDLLVTVDGDLLTFLRIDGEILAELKVAGQA
ncbi:MAG TPA: hypothetical protein VHB21_11575 [Minicystis sp.]|nr:hypothetical protein [Minicystis sp.]